MYVQAEKVCPSGRLRFRILAPSRIEPPKSLTQPVVRSADHSKFMVALQKLRGRVYSECAPVAERLLPDGRDFRTWDASSWHILLEDSQLGIVACSWYRPASSFEDLISSQGALALSPETAFKFRSTFEKQMAQACRKGLRYGEVGGWALSEAVRCSTVAVNIALMGFALAEWLEAGICIATASTRHHASLILRRLGGSPFADFAPYYEPHYDTVLELLQFEMAQLHPRYLAKLDQMREELQRTTILAPPLIELEQDEPVPTRLGSLNYFPVPAPEYSAALQ